MALKVSLDRLTPASLDSRNSLNGAVSLDPRSAVGGFQSMVTDCTQYSKRQRSISLFKSFFDCGHMLHILCRMALRNWRSQMKFMLDYVGIYWIVKSTPRRYGLQSLGASATDRRD